MSDNISLTDEDLRMLGLEIEESAPKKASPDPGGSDKTLTQEEIDAMIASMGK